MFKKVVLGLLVAGVLMSLSTGNAMADPFYHGYVHGWGHGPVVYHAHYWHYWWDRFHHLRRWWG